MADEGHLPKRRGRPPLDPASGSVHLTVRISTKEYDRLYGEAARQRVSLCDLIRAGLRRGVPPRHPPE